MSNIVLNKSILTVDNEPNYALFPLKYEWAWTSYKAMLNNIWTPEEKGAADDIENWKMSKLTEEEQHMYLTVFAQLTTFDLMRTADLVQNLLPYISAPEIIQALTFQAAQEAIHCYIEGTQVLTENGWMDFREIEDNTLVAQYHEEGNISFVKHLGKTIDNFDGNLIRFANSAMEFIVTPDHKCCYRPQIRKDSGPLLVCKAKDLPGAYLPVAAHNGDEGKLSPIDRLKIAFQADGNKHITKNNRVNFHLKKKRKIKRLIKILDKCGIEYKIYKYTNTTKISFIKPPEIVLDKEFNWVNPINITWGWARSFIKELVKWDGSTIKKTMYYYNNNESALNVVQYIATFGGYHARLKRYKGRVPQINFVSTNYISTLSLVRERYPYKGKVYSIGVPTHNLIVRYNEHVLISQNTHSYTYLTESIGFPQEDIYTRYKRVDILRERCEFTRKIATLPPIELIQQRNPETLLSLLKSLIFYYCIFEGVWFYLNLLGPVQALARRRLMLGTATQFQYIARDEQTHVMLGEHLIKGIIAENKDVLSDIDMSISSDFGNDLKNIIDNALYLEDRFIDYAIPSGMLGYNILDHQKTARHYAERWLKRVGFHFNLGGEHKLPWIDEQLSLRKEKNFFETRVTEYRVGANLWGEEEEPNPTHPEWDDPLKSIKN